MDNCLKELIEVITITGKGTTKKEAVEKAFSNLQKEVFKKVPDPIIHMVPNKVIFRDVRETEKDEAFLYVFMKRTTTTFEVTIDVEVTIKYIEL